MSTRTRISDRAFSAKIIRKKSLIYSDSKKIEKPKEKKIKKEEIVRKTVEVILDTVVKNQKIEDKVNIDPIPSKLEKIPNKRPEPTKKELFGYYKKYLEEVHVVNEKYCFRCKYRSMDTLKCGHDHCIKQFHEKCISFEDDFICGRHSCNECGSTEISQFCKLCETSFCVTHKKSEEKQFICGECQNILK
jgi:hypothetical protein